MEKIRSLVYWISFILPFPTSRWPSLSITSFGSLLKKWHGTSWMIVKEQKTTEIQSFGSEIQFVCRCTMRSDFRIRRNCDPTGKTTFLRKRWFPLKALIILRDTISRVGSSKSVPSGMGWKIRHIPKIQSSERMCGKAWKQCITMILSGRIWQIVPGWNGMVSFRLSARCISMGFFGNLLVCISISVSMIGSSDPIWSMARQSMVVCSFGNIPSSLFGNGLKWKMMMTHFKCVRDAPQYVFSETYWTCVSILCVNDWIFGSHRRHTRCGWFRILSGMHFRLQKGLKWTTALISNGREIQVGMFLRRRVGENFQYGVISRIFGFT